MSFVDADWQGRAGHRLPHRLHRRARLRAAAALGRRRADLWDALVEAAAASAGGRAASARGTRCAPRWATRCTGTSCSLDITPGAGAGRLGGRLEEGRTSGAATRWWPRRRPVRAACRGGCSRSGPGHPAADMRRGPDARDMRLGEVTVRHLLAHAQAGHRAGAAGDRRRPRATRSVVDVRGPRGGRRGGQAAVRAGADPAGRARRLTSLPGPAPDRPSRCPVAEPSAGSAGRPWPAPPPALSRRGAARGRRR